MQKTVSAAGSEQQRVICSIGNLLTDLKSCSIKRDLQWGRRIHENAVQSQNDTNKHVATTLIKMYAKCGSMADARRVFDGIQKPDLVTWNVMLLGYAENGKGDIVLEMFSKMEAHGCAPDSFTYVAALKACANLAVNRDGSKNNACLERGRKIHSQIRCHLDRFLQNTLVDMYAKCGSMCDARRVFDRMQKHDVVSWTTLLMGYADCGQGQVALEMFYKMKSSGCEPDSVSYVAALKACASLAADGDYKVKAECLERGRELHLETRGHTDRYVQNMLIDMYSNCGSVAEARQVFDRLQKPDVISWTSLIMGYAEAGEGHVSLDLFSKMKTTGCVPNSITYVAVLKACTSLVVDGDRRSKEQCLRLGRDVHLEAGAHLDIRVQNTLIDMYAKCGSMVYARQVFNSIENPNVISWTALVQGYADTGEDQTALETFSNMKKHGCVPCSLTYVAALRACTPVAATADGSTIEYCLERGRQIHSEIGSNIDHYVQNTLIGMYAKCSSMADAHSVFNSINEPDVVAWTALLSGYAENGLGHVALDLFSKMKERGCVPDSITYGAVIKACGFVGEFVLGRKFHCEVPEFTSHVVACLIDFYAKCGSLSEAREVFDLHTKVRTISVWTSMLAGYAKFGDSGSVFELFEAMQDEGLQPDGVTFLSLILCCSHAGLVDKAREYFEVMTVRYRVTPTMMHYNCMVDVMGRANKLNEALAMIRKMPFDPDAVTWMTLLGACHKWKNVEIGRVVAGALQAMAHFDKGNASAYVLMAHMWEEQECSGNEDRVCNLQTGL